MIIEGVRDALKGLLRIEDIPVNIPPNRQWGDLSSAVCLSMAREKRKSPMEIANEIAEKLGQNLPPFIQGVTVSAPGYINFKVDWLGLAQNLIPRIIQEGENFGKQSAQPKLKVFI